MALTYFRCGRSGYPTSGMGGGRASLANFLLQSSPSRWSLGQSFHGLQTRQEVPLSLPSGVRKACFPILQIWELPSLAVFLY